MSGDYSHPPPEGAGDLYVQPDQGIRPQMFKSLIGRGHNEFSTKRQQDAQEFILHIFNLIEVSHVLTRIMVVGKKLGDMLVH
jgi:ubiquitin carboxyl-terminal hydrolase 5/13